MDSFTCTRVFKLITRFHIKWHEQGGPQAYLGTTLSGFPNLYTLLGPNVASGSASVVYSSEAQVNLIIKMLEPMVHHGVRSWEAKVDAEKTYNLEIHEALGAFFHILVWLLHL